MIEGGEYLFSRVGFSQDETPLLTFAKNETFFDANPLGQDITLQFSISQRFCIGWSDILQGTRYTCPEASAVQSMYEQCNACQQRTGFNPAFYNATSVSSQQEARNAEPHILYLAYFGDKTIKVGISYAGRNNSRLLEQGARSALILETFPSANIARSYEAKIAQIPGIAETIQLRKKITLLHAALEPNAAHEFLLHTRSQIEQQLNVSFAKNHPQSFDHRYFPTQVPDLKSAHDCSDQHAISGEVIGQLGSLLFMKQDDTVLFLPLKKYIGYNVTVSHDRLEIITPPQQISLF